MLREAAHQTLFHDERTSLEFQSYVLSEACKSLGLPMNAFEKWKSNFLADIYAADTPELRLILKIVVMRQSGAAKAQFESLSALQPVSAASDAFQMPTPILLLEGLSSYAMSFLDGHSLTESISNPRAEVSKIREWVRSAGYALAEIHGVWAEEPGTVDVVSILEELRTNSPWRMGPEAAGVFDSLESTLLGVQLPRARLYLDFDPVNVLVKDATPIGLLDPPEEVVIGPIHWDLGTFMLGLERAHWRKPWMIANRRDVVRVLKRDFLDAYREAATSEVEPIDHVVCELAEIVRLAQLALWWQRPTRLRRKLLAISRNMYSKVLLSRSWKEHLEDLKVRMVNG